MRDIRLSPMNDYYIQPGTTFSTWGLRSGHRLEVLAVPDTLIGCSGCVGNATAVNPATGKTEKNCNTLPACGNISFVPNNEESIVFVVKAKLGAPANPVLTECQGTLTLKEASP